MPYIDMNQPWVYMSSQSWTPLPPHIISLDHPWAPAPDILYSVSNIDWLFISYMIVYMFQCHFPKSSHTLPLPQSPKVCSIHLCLFCCLTYRVIVTILLNSIYMCQYTVVVFFFLAYFTLYNRLQFHPPHWNWFKCILFNGWVKMGIPDHLTCLLRNLYADQEARVRTGHRTTDWFQIGKSTSRLYIVTLLI